MSAEIFLQCFRNKALHYFPVSVVERTFGPHIASRDTDEAGGLDSHWRIGETLGGHGEVHLRRSDQDQSLMTGLMLNGASAAMFDLVFEIAKETQSVVYWPGGTRYVVAGDSDPSAHLPDNFLDIFPARLVVNSGAEIQERVCG